MKLFDVYPVENINITRASGSWLWDDQERRYLDMYGGHAVISIGHAHPRWIAALEQQMNQISFYSNSILIPIQQRLADAMGRISKKEDYQLFLCNSGAEANENALKLASFHNGRKQVIAFDKGFHGRTALAVAATDNPSIIAPVNETANVVFLPFNDEKALQDHFDKHGALVSSVIVEGIQGVGGIRVANASFLQLIRKLCTQHNALYIADSVQCGYGRSGRFFSHDFADVDADIYSMAKGMGNGFPVGGIMIAPHIQAKKGLLGTTFGGNHLACAAGLAVLETIEEEGLLQVAQQSGNYLLEKLREIPQLQNVRGRGLMIGFDLPEAFSSLRKVLLNDLHVFTGTAAANTIRLLPALNIAASAIDEFIARLEQAILLIGQK